MPIYNISVHLNNLVASGDTTITDTATVTLTAHTGYRVPVEIIVIGADNAYDDYTDPLQGVISLSNPTGDVTITASGLTEEERFFADLNGIADVVNEKAGTSGEKYLPQIRHTAESIQTSSADPYEGSYDITPIASADIELATRNKSMTDNLVVRKIPYHETTNLSGGYTAIIGG